jgi:RNA-directed DNA polymerase
MGLRVKDRGESERRLVMSRIGVAAVANITPRESAPTSAWSHITTELGKTAKEARQMAGERVRGDRQSAPPSPGAAFHEGIAWDRIDWTSAYDNVRRLQVRIVKATKEGRWNKVQALQRLLTRSYSGKLLAVRRVTANRGKRTPGVDGQTWTTPARKATAVHELRRRGYRPKPLRRVYIEKRNKKLRPLGIPVMKDRAMQALHLLALSPIAETTGDENSYGFRPERSAADAIEQCFTLLAKKGSPQWILEGDIKSCFDQISHDWLLTHVPMERSVLRKWLKAGFMDESVIYPTEDGTPQGGVASPVLANMALDGLQRALRERFPKLPTGSTLHRVNMARYADDFIVTGDSKEVLAGEVRPLLERFLGERGLQLSSEKTAVTHIEAGFDFLGQTVRKFNGKLLTKPSKEARCAFLRRVREVIKANKAVSAGALVRLLNPLIRGWVLYHRHVVSSKTFAFVDQAIWKALWRWARRRHPSKNLGWVRAKYFPAHRGRQWVFTGQVTKANGKKQALRIFLATSVAVRRHISIRGAANPFDPEWTSYFKDRRARKRKDAFCDKLRFANRSLPRQRVDRAGTPSFGR